MGKITGFSLLKPEDTEVKTKVLDENTVNDLSLIFLAATAAGHDMEIRILKDILAEKPDGKSFAREIAEKYGITFEQLSAKHMH